MPGIEAEDAGRAARRRVKSQQRIDERGFSGAVRAQQPDGVAAQFAGQTVENGPPAEPHLKSIKLDDTHVIALRVDRSACSGNPG